MTENMESTNLSAFLNTNSFLEEQGGLNMMNMENLLSLEALTVMISLIITSMACRSQFLQNLQMTRHYEFTY